jgi:hypothetical protein
MDPAIEGFADKARPLSTEEKAMIATAARRLDEQVAKKQMGVDLGTRRQLAGGARVAGIEANGKY